MKPSLGKALYLALVGLLALVFVFSAAQVVKRLAEEDAAEAYYEELSSLVREPHAAPAATAPDSPPADQGSREPAEPASTSTEPAPRAILPQYQALYERNPDLFGWIQIPGTSIDYPVMYTPQDPEFYLRRDFDKNERRTGVPFLDCACPPEGNHYLIYGHNMKNGAMFGALLSYQSRDYWQDHRRIRLDTLYEERVYEVVAAIYSEASEEDTGAFRYYEYRDLSDPERFQAYVEAVKAAALYETNLTAAWGDELLTLSTCAYHTDNGRFVVVAKRIQ